MPIFAYECARCKMRVERLYVHNESVPHVKGCSCGGLQHRVVTAANFKINGFSEANGYAEKGNNEQT